MGQDFKTVLIFATLRPPGPPQDTSGYPPLNCTSAKSRLGTRHEL